MDRSNLELDREILETFSSRRPLWVKPNWSNGIMGRSSFRMSEKRISASEGEKKEMEITKRKITREGEAMTKDGVLACWLFVEMTQREISVYCHHFWFHSDGNRTAFTTQPQRNYTRTVMSS